jgi:hypothetical protein
MSRRIGLNSRGFLSRILRGSTPVKVAARSPGFAIGQGALRELLSAHGPRGTLVRNHHDEDPPPGGTWSFREGNDPPRATWAVEVIPADGHAAWTVGEWATTVGPRGPVVRGTKGWNQATLDAREALVHGAIEHASGWRWV